MSEIRHQWNGSVLTVISDSGASSADLKGPKGDTGPRGPQGPGGVIYNEDGELVLDLSEYYSRSEVDTLIENVEVDLSDYATHADVLETLANEIEFNDELASKNYVSTEIAKAQLEGAGVDTSGFATKDDLKDYVTQEEHAKIAVDGTSIVQNADGTISTMAGGSKTQSHATVLPGVNFIDENQLKCKITLREEDNNLIQASDTICIQIKFLDGKVDTIVGTCPKVENYEGLSYTMKSSSTGLTYISGISYSSGKHYSTGKLYQSFAPEYDVLENREKVIADITMTLGAVPGGVITPINAAYIPVDGETIIVKDGKLTVVGGNGDALASSEEVRY